MSKPFKKANTNKKGNNQDDNRTLEDSEFIGIITRKLGNLMFEVSDKEGNLYKAKLKSSLKKRVRVSIGMIGIVENVLNLYEIVHVYSADRERELKSEFKKEIVDITRTTEDNMDIEFDIDAI